MRISNKGFTLIEVMLAAVILGIGCLGVLGLMITSIKYNNNSHMRTKATYIAEQQVTRFQLANDTCSAGATAWHHIDSLSDTPDDTTFSIYCKQITGTTSSPAPIAIRVVWAESTGSCDVDNLGTFTNARANSHCDFITLSYVPFNTF